MVLAQVDFQRLGPRELRDVKRRRLLTVLTLHAVQLVKQQGLELSRDSTGAALGVKVARALIPCEH